MDTFEFNEKIPHDCRDNWMDRGDGQISDAPVLVYKIYGSCRRQRCLSYEQLGSAHTGGHCHSPCREENEVVNVPHGTEFATVDKLRIKNIRIIQKRPNPRCVGHWDIRAKFTFEYLLTFWDDDGNEISSVEASNAFVAKETLLGSSGDDDRVIGTNFCGDGEMLLFDTSPFVMVRGKAVSLDVSIHHSECQSEARVDIGLFSDISLFRPMCLNVLSKLSDIPDLCEDVAFDPCSYFMDDKYSLLTFTAGESGLNDAARSLKSSARA